MAVKELDTMRGREEAQGVKVITGCLHKKLGRKDKEKKNRLRGKDSGRVGFH